MAVGGGPRRGIEFLPEINDEVLVGFEQDDVRYAYVLGGLWNGQDAPPGDPGDVIGGGKIQRRVIRSRAGHLIVLDDSDGAGGNVEDRSGNAIALESAATSCASP